MSKNKKFSCKKEPCNSHTWLYLLTYITILVFPFGMSSFDYAVHACWFLAGIVLFFMSLFSILKNWKKWRVLSGCVLMFPSIFYLLDVMPVSICFMGLRSSDIMAILQTNVPEAISYIWDHLNIWLFAFLLSFFAFFVYLSVLQNKREKGFVKNQWINLICMGIGFLLICWNVVNAVTFPFYETFLNIQKQRDFYNNLKNRPVPENIQKNTLNGVYVIIIGESQNRDRMSVYGYNEHNTTPFLSEMSKNKNWFFFEQAYSCDVYTIAALTYALTQKNNYNDMQLEDAYSIMEILDEFNTYWISNQKPVGYYGEPITEIGLKAKSSVFINKSFVDADPYDGDLLERLPKEQELQGVSVVFIHLMGNHGSYANRYPESYKKWKDAYDNSMLYNDHIVQKIYEHFAAMDNFVSLMYFSDHSEDIKCECHNPSQFSWDMTKIPFYIYLSDKYIKQYPHKIKALKKHGGVAFTNDLIFDTMLGMLDITDKRFYVPGNDFFSTKYTHNIKNLSTAHGEKPLSEQFKSAQTTTK